MTAPNETKNGIKNGLWNEQEFLDSMNIDGNTIMIYGQHYTPLYAISEGLYFNGEKTGLWKYFWIEAFLDSNRVRYRKGQLKDIIEFEQGYRNGLFLSYFKSGQIRLLGHYKKIKEFSIDTIQFTNPDTGLEKDTVIISNYTSIMTGKWYEFDNEGNLNQIKAMENQPIKKHDE